MFGTPAIIRSKYERTVHLRGGNGESLLCGIPQRNPIERREIKRVLSAYHCRRCGKCCRGGFSITPDDPNYKEIIDLMRARKENFLLKATYRSARVESVKVYASMGDNACGFLASEPAEKRIPIWALEESDGKEDGEYLFGCGIYKKRPSSCKIYPLYPGWPVSEREARGILRPIALDANCAAVWELLENGVGHISLKELEELGSEAQEEAPESILAGLRNSVAELKRRLCLDPQWGTICRKENGEEIIPIDAREILQTF